jgi:hypothetical protein
LVHKYGVFWNRSGEFLQEELEYIVENRCCKATGSGLAFVGDGLEEVEDSDTGPGISREVVGDGRFSRS